MTLLWKPLLSATLPLDPETNDFKWGLIPFPVYASTKIDGFRSMVQCGVLVSRNGLPVKNRELQARYGRKQYEGLDGELTDGPANGDDVFHRTSSVVKKATADASQTTFNVIDRVTTKPIYDLRTRVEELSCHTKVEDGLVTIRQVPIEGILSLKKFEAKCLAQGFEGVMLRRADQGAYPQKPGKENRSTLREFYLCRVKRFEQAEATIVSISYLEHNLNEDRTGTGRRSSKKANVEVDETQIGGALLRDCVTGKEFSTSVAREALRRWEGWQDERLWKGKKVRYKYQLVGTVDKPRINTCKFSEVLP